MSYEKPVYPPGKSTKRKLIGGPWAGQSIGFREDQTELVLVRHNVALLGAEGSIRDGDYLGRYVVRKVQQKTRVITKVEWETREQKRAAAKRLARRWVHGVG